MIKPEDINKYLKKNKITFFTGVPDSTLKNLTDYFDDKNYKNCIAVNEGSAVSIATGYYLNNKKIPCVYMQNSGLTNSLNPLLSNIHKSIYGIPMVLIIGHRGFGGKNDEPQHLLTGKVTTKILELADIKYVILNNKKDLIRFDALIKFAKKKQRVVALIIKNNSIQNHKNKKSSNNYKIKVNEFFEKVNLKTKNLNFYFIISTGYPSREFYAHHRTSFKSKAFYSVGGMGHTTSLAMGMSLKNNKKIICIDGDGSLLMHLGSLHSLKNSNIKNFKHILINNNCHASVGKQKTGANKINFRNLCKSLNYTKYFSIKKKSEIDAVLNKFLQSKGRVFLEVFCKDENSSNLPRVKNFQNIKENFMK